MNTLVKKKRDLTLAGAILTGLGATTTVVAGIGYAMYINQNITDTEYFKCLVILNIAGSPADLAADAIASATVNAKISTKVIETLRSVANAATGSVFGINDPTATNDTTFKDRISIANKAFASLSLGEKINFYKSETTYCKLFIENLQTNNVTLESAKIKSLQDLLSAAQKELNMLYTSIAFLAGVGPGLVIAGIPTLTVGLLTKNK